MRLKLIAAAVVATVSLAGAGVGHADALSWSYASANVGYTPYSGPNSPLPHVTLSADQVHGSNLDASASASDPTWGHAAAWADNGASGLVPELHAIVVGAPSVPGKLFGGGANVQGVQAVTWTGGAFDFDPSWLEGTLDYTASAAGFNYINAGFAIIDGSAFASHPGLGAEYFQSGVDPSTGAGGVFAANCGTAGAVGVANAGPSNAGGAVTLTAVMKSCGPIHLENGDSLVFWSKLNVFHAGDGYTDASHTFSINFADGVDDTIRTSIVQNLVPTGFNPSVGVPEPATWAMMLLGLCGVGAALRRRRMTMALA